jgi:hypothetical protein
LRFDPEELKQCGSAQLRTVGGLSVGGMVNVDAMAGTIVYSVDSDRLNHNYFKLKVLTVVDTLTPRKANLVSEAGSHKGTAGHVLLTYPSGGTIMTSMGHWIELMKIDTTPEKLF